jgi:cell wall-associated NlpC family hydrolase
MKTITKYSALASTILLTSALAGPAKAEAPSTAELTQVPTQTSQLPTVKAEKNSLIKFEKPVVTTTSADTTVDPVAAPVAPETAISEPVPVTPETPVQALSEAVPAPAAPTPAPAPKTTPAPSPTPKAAPSASGKGATIAAAAYAQIGVSQDCTALVSNALAAAGINFHGWPNDYASLGTVVSNPQPGDILIYQNAGAGVPHVAIYVGNGMAIHGGWNGGTTVLFSANVGSGYFAVRV